MALDCGTSAIEALALADLYAVVDGHGAAVGQMNDSGHILESILAILVGGEG